MAVDTCRSICLYERVRHAVQIKVANTPGKKVEHQGIRVQLLGQIELKTERGSPQDFLALGMACDTCSKL